MLDPNTVLQDRYLVERKLGQGGMGAVYLAVDQKFGTTVALKQTLVTGDLLARAFEREARLLNKLRHGALPVVIDYFRQGEEQFLVMQYIPGEDFAALLADRGKPFPAADVLRWADSLLDALDYLHGQDPPVVHRDIKPQNLKLTPRGEIVLLDFGLAKGIPVDLATASTTGSIFGYTPHYAPFEQIKGSGTDPRSDLYSLAATLYHLLTGAIPPDAMSRAEAVMLRKDDPLQPANAVNPDVPAAVAHVLAKSLAMDRDERFASAAEMRAALQAAVDHGTHPIVSLGTSAMGAPDLDSTAEPKATVAAGAAEHPHEHPKIALQTAVQHHTTHLAQPQARSRPLLWVGVGVLLVALGVGGGLLVRSRTEPPQSAAPVTPAPAADPGLILTAPGVTSFAFETVSITPTGQMTNRRQATGQSFDVDLGGGVTMEMVRIPAGKFDRGSSDAENGRYADEGPVQEVTISEFFLGRTEVTQAQWRAVAALPKVRVELPPDPSEFKGDDRPVENISWEQAAEFCDRVSQHAHRFFRLPSESEWEYACRAGTKTPFAFGPTLTNEFANFNGELAYGAGPKGEAATSTTPVGNFKIANGFGLYDMHGNVWEWCFGQYHDTWEGAPIDGSSWLEGGDNRLRSIRGGAWNSLVIDCRSANRSGIDVYDSHRAIGLRVAMRPGPPDSWAVRK